MGDPLSDLSAAVAGRYRVERELGARGMATVYLADDVRHQRRVAIKVVRPELAAALGAERFLREISTTASLRHPHIVPLYDSGEGDGLMYYVMPFVEGESLRDRLRRQKQLPLDEALRITADVADARRLASRYSTTGWAFPQWSADGRTVYHVTEDSGRTIAVVAAPVDGGPGRIVVRFDDATRLWHRYGFRVRAGRMYFTLGDRESDVWVVDLGR